MKCEERGGRNLHQASVLSSHNLSWCDLEEFTDVRVLSKLPWILDDGDFDELLSHKPVMADSLDLILLLLPHLLLNVPFSVNTFVTLNEPAVERFLLLKLWR